MIVPALLLTLLTLAELDIVFLDLSVLVCVWFRVEAQEEQEIRAITTSIHILSH